jgi:hypothetical protein
MNNEKIDDFDGSDLAVIDGCRNRAETIKTRIGR